LEVVYRFNYCRLIPGIYYALLHPFLKVFVFYEAATLFDAFFGQPAKKTLQFRAKQFSRFYIKNGAIFL